MTTLTDTHYNNLLDHPNGIKVHHEASHSAQPFALPSFQRFILTWKIHYETKFGESLAIVGNIKELGSWSTQDALSLHWSENNVWVGSTILDIHEDQSSHQMIEYKYILIDEKTKSVQWEDGQNRFYYYSQIRVEAFPKSQCTCTQSFQQQSKTNEHNRITNNTNSLQYHHNTNNNTNHSYKTRFNPHVTVDNNCYHQMYIEDEWNKKAVIFRIRDLCEKDSVIDCDNKDINQGITSEPNCTIQRMSNDKINEQTSSFDNCQQEQKSSSNSCKSISALSSSTCLSSGKLDFDSDNLSFNNNSNENLKEVQQFNTNSLTYYVTGNNKAIGNLRHLSKMNYNLKLKCWELKAFVDRDTQYIRYFYIKKDANNNFQWEKGSGRFLYMQPLHNPLSFNASTIDSCIQSSIQSSHSLSDSHFGELKSEIIQQTEMRQSHNKHSICVCAFSQPESADYHHSNKTSHCILCNQQNDSKDNNDQTKKRFLGKIHVNPLHKGNFLSEIKEDQLDFSLQFDRISEQLFIGPYISNNESEINALKLAGVDTVLSLQTDDDMQRRQVDKNQLKEQYRKNGIEYYNVPIKDKSFKDFFLKSQGAVDKLNTLLKSQKRVVYLHCTGGISRAPQTAILYYTLYKNYSLKRATKFICSKRQSAFPDQELLLQVYNKVIESLEN